MLGETSSFLGSLPHRIALALNVYLIGVRSCLLVVLNSNMELTLWGPVKNLLTGEWTRVRLVPSITSLSAEKTFAS